MSIPEFALLKGPEFSYSAGSALLAPMGGVRLDSRVSFSRNQEHEFVIGSPLAEPWVELATPGRVVRMVLQGHVSEWWIGSRVDGVSGDEGEQVVFGLDPLHTQLTDVGPMEDVRTGGVSWYQGGGLGLSAKNYLNTYLLPHLSRRGIDYYTIGTIESLALLRIQFAGKFPLGLIIHLAEELEMEWYIDRDEAARKYRINIVAQLGASVPNTIAAEAFNLIDVQRERQREEMRTIIRPVGGIAGDSQRQADIGWNVWRVTAVGSDDVTVEAHDGLAGPIAEDDQWAEVQRDGEVIWSGAYLQASDGTRHLIEGSVAASQTFELEGGAGSAFAVGDDVSIVRDSDGTLLTEIPSPSGLAAYGVIAGPYEDTNFRGERNWVKSPFAADWADGPRWLHAMADGAQASATINFTGVEAGVTIPAGSILYKISNGEFITPLHIVTGGVSDSSFDITLEMEGGVSLANGESVYINTGPLREPEGWELDETRRVGLLRYDASTVVEGDTTTGITFAPDATVAVAVGEGNSVPAGAMLYVAGESDPRVVLESVTAGGSGFAWCPVIPRGLSIGSSTAVEIVIPSIVRHGGQYIPGILGRGTTSSPWSGPLVPPAASLRAVLGATRVIFAVEVTVENASPADTATIQSGNSPRAQLWRTDGTPSTVAEVRAIEAGADDVDVPVGATWTARLQGEWEVPAGETPDLEIRVSGAQATVSSRLLIVWIPAATISLSEDSALTPVEGYHGVTLFRRAQTALQGAKSWAGSYAVRLLDYARLLGTPPELVRSDVGSFVRVETSAPRIYELLRIERREFSVHSPENPRLILERIPDRLSQQTKDLRRQTPYVRIDEDIEVDGETIHIGLTVIPEFDPPTVAGVPRAGVGSVAVDPDSDDPVPILSFGGST